MGAVLSDLFVDPESLPGGRCFSPSCPGFYSLDEDTGKNVTQCRIPTGNVASWEWWHLEGHLEHPGLYADCKTLAPFGFIQILFLAGVYGMILSWASDLISNGSEMLLLVPAYRGIVGSVVLPVLGAVPDGAIILFSGLGSDAKNQIVVGVGALAGSTIMLITLPWFIAVFAGKVPVAYASDGSFKTVYNNRFQEVVIKHNKEHPPKTMLPAWLFTSGVKTNRDTRVSGKIMLATAMLYLVIQLPAFFAFGRLEHGKYDESADNVVKLEHPWFILGVVLCFLAFAAYLWWCVKTSQDNENTSSKVDVLIDNAISDGKLTLTGAFFNDLSFSQRRDSISGDDSESQSLLANDPVARAQRRVEQFLHKKFTKYDTDKSGSIEGSELHVLFNDLGESTADFAEFKEAMDKDKNGIITFDEFKEHMIEYIQSKVAPKPAHMSLAEQSVNDGDAMPSIDDIVTMPTDDDADEEEDEENETGLDPKTQQWEIKKSAFKMMGIGTLVVLVVSDPAVDVLSSLGARTGIPAFYIAFVLAPMASNASELIAAYNYAQKKTPASIGVSLATLEGAGIMNNTFCLGIFFLIIFINDDIAWTFTAETLGILFVEIAVAIIAQKETMTLFDACCVVSMYPMSLLFIALLETYTPLN
eukprot:m.197382 g.197382  ORF g.197382 m.197382 type:complete len:643 (-) comp25089_c2_seq1:2829-4757(-)